MDTVDITPTPEACQQIARLFAAQKRTSAQLASLAAQALALVEGRTDAALEPWGRDLLTAAFAALHDAERARVRHMDDGLEALGLAAEADDGEGSDDAA